MGFSEEDAPCDGATVVQTRQKVFAGYAEEVVDAASYDDCVQACLTNDNIKCLSGNFFYDVSSLHTFWLLTSSQVRH